MNTPSGQQRIAVAVGIAACTPYARASYEAEATTPRPEVPPTITGRPWISGRSIISTAAKKQSMSRCKRSSASPSCRFTGTSVVDLDAPEGLGKCDTRPPAGLLRAFADDEPEPLARLSELTLMAQDRLRLLLDGRSDVDGDVRFEGARHVGDCDRGGISEIGKVQGRTRGGRC